MSRRLPYLIAPIIGLALIAPGAWFAYDNVQFRERADRVPATIVGMDTDSDSDGTTYAPIYAFEYDGERQREQATVHTSSRPTIGARVTVLVDPDDTSRVKADNFWEQWFIATLLCGIGASFLLIGGFVFVITRSAERAQRRLGGARTQPSGDAPEPTDDATAHRGPFL